MRRAIFVLFFLLIPLAFAKTETTKVLNINDTATVYGKTLTVLSADVSGKLKVSVDGVEGIVKPGVNRTSNVNEMFIEILNFTYIDEEYVETILKVVVNYECGDNACDLTETKQSCCTDCGCEGNLKCIDNICMKEDCVIQADCDDNNPCTVDKCSDTPPRTCSNTLITKCVNDDGCCLEDCSAEKDNDCVTEEKVEGHVEEGKEEKAEIVKEEVEVEEPKVEKEALITEEERGILIMAGVALFVVIIGFFVFTKK